MMFDPADCWIAIRSGALGAASTVVRLSHPNEIGGILIGYRTDDSLVVVDALAVPSEMRPTRYERSHELASIVLDTYFSVVHAESEVGYVGEWHAHPSPHSASSQDLKELAEIAEASDSVVGLIVLGADREQIVPFGYLCDSTGVPWPVELSVIDITPDISRKSVEGEARDMPNNGHRPRLPIVGAAATGAAIALVVASLRHNRETG